MWRARACRHNAHGEVEYRGFVGSLSALRRGSLLTVILLFALLSLLLLVILAIADYALQTQAFPGAFAIVVGLAVLFIFFQWLISPAIVRWAIRDRRPITAESNPWVYRTAEELARQAGVPTPKIWESGDASPNAFVFGRTISSAELVITQGLLERLNQDEERPGLGPYMMGDPVKAEEDYRELQDRMSRYDLDRDGQLDAYELQRAVEQERKSHWRRANELFGTHPPTYKRILVLEEMEEEIKKGGLPQNIYKFV